MVSRSSNRFSECTLTVNISDSKEMKGMQYAGRLYTKGVTIDENFVVFQGGLSTVHSLCRLTQDMIICWLQ